MNKGQISKISKYMSYILRHKPEDAGITLDEHGWADVGKLVSAVGKKFPGFDVMLLMCIVGSDEKQRYSLNENGSKIRANQGHSIRVDLELEAVTPPDILYHGTTLKYVESIRQSGLKPKSRQYVHLSKDMNTAFEVGKRHGKPYVYMIDTHKMWEDGHEFFLSENGVWLTKEVPAKYLGLRVTRDLEE